MKKIVILSSAAVLGLAAAGFAWMGAAEGFSARQQPTAVEAALARRMRLLAVPRAAREMANPMPLTAELLTQARHHFADHCAQCHANDGSGNTEMGKNLYPKAPDMRRAATQSLSDGELYFIIHNGIRMSGMPAWGEESGHDHDSWALVHFIRGLPRLTPAELQEMARYNPLSPEELKEQQEEEDFLNGKSDKK